MQPVLTITALLTGRDPTGVATGFDQRFAEARAAGINARLVSARYRRARPPRILVWRWQNALMGNRIAVGTSPPSQTMGLQ